VRANHGAQKDTPGHAALRRRRSASGSLGALLRLLLRLRLLGIVVLDVLEHARIREEAVDAIGRGRALGEPRLRLVEIELEPVGMILRQQRIVITDSIDEAAVARAAR